MLAWELLGVGWTLPSESVIVGEVQDHARANGGTGQRASAAQRQRARSGNACQGVGNAGRARLRNR